jgi:hypothetical protein
MDAKEVRDEIVVCLVKVHKEFIREAGTKSSQKRLAIALLKKAMHETKGDYDTPTGNSLKKSVEWLIKSMPLPENPGYAKEHRKKIIRLIKTIDDD